MTNTAVIQDPAVRTDMPPGDMREPAVRGEQDEMPSGVMHQPPVPVKPGEMPSGAMEPVESRR